MVSDVPDDEPSRVGSGPTIATQPISISEASSPMLPDIPLPEPSGPMPSKVHVVVTAREADRKSSTHRKLPVTIMGNGMTLEQLTNLFTSLGAPDPKSWAVSQVEEGIPQLGRFLFLRQAWKQVINPADNSWMHELAAVGASGTEEAESAALNRILGAGAAPEDVTTLVRAMQWRLLFAFCYLLDDPREIEDEVAKVGWALFHTNAEGEPTIRLAGLHEAVMETDPS